MNYTVVDNIITEDAAARLAGRSASLTPSPKMSCSSIILAAPWSSTDVRGTAPQFCGRKFIDTGAMAVPIASVSGIRRLERDRIVITGPSRFQPARPEVLR